MGQFRGHTGTRTWYTTHTRTPLTTTPQCHFECQCQCQALLVLICIGSRSCWGSLYIPSSSSFFVSRLDGWMNGSIDRSMIWDVGRHEMKKTTKSSSCTIRIPRSKISWTLSKSRGPFRWSRTGALTLVLVLTFAICLSKLHTMVCVARTNAFQNHLTGTANDTSIGCHWPNSTCRFCLKCG